MALSTSTTLTLLTFFSLLSLLLRLLSRASASALAPRSPSTSSTCYIFRILPAAAADDVGGAYTVRRVVCFGSRHRCSLACPADDPRQGSRLFSPTLRTLVGEDADAASSLCLVVSSRANATAADGDGDYRQIGVAGCSDLGDCRFFCTGSGQPRLIRPPRAGGNRPPLIDAGGRRFDLDERDL